MDAYEIYTAQRRGHRLRVSMRRRRVLLELNNGSTQPSARLTLEELRALRRALDQAERALLAERASATRDEVALQAITALTMSGGDD